MLHNVITKKEMLTISLKDLTRKALNLLRESIFISHNPFVKKNFNLSIITAIIYFII
jgi:hypothetical protein